MIHIISTFYISKYSSHLDNLRSKELERCLINNLYCPFVEKHRPTQFHDIVLDPLNKKILNNIIETSYFPNLLFYGPPGTGKTTTIINLINAYQAKLNSKRLLINL